MRNFADPNVLFGTTVIFPNTVARGRASGIDLHLEVPPQKGWSGYLSYSNGHVVQFGPINGGLFLEQNYPDIGPGTRFTPDHDAILSYYTSHAGKGGNITQWLQVMSRWAPGTGCNQSYYSALVPCQPPNPCYST